jgi:hypothetical protein
LNRNMKLMFYTEAREYVKRIRPCWSASATPLPVIP